MSIRVVLFEHPRIPSAHRFNDIANTPLWSCLMTGYAASSLIHAGCDARIVDAAKASFEEAVDLAVETAPDILAVHAVYFWENTGKLFDMLAEIRKKGYPGIICLFGFFPTLAWNDILRHAEAVDCIVVGEPEDALVELARHFFSFGAVRPSPGIAARFSGRPTLPSLRAPIEPLDRLPFPVRPGIEAAETVSILASRGCYNGCSFCLVPTIDGGRRLWRCRSAANVLIEINDLVAQGKSHIYFVDPNFIGPGKSGQENAAMLADSLAGLGITFGMETRTNDVNKTILQRLRHSGLTSLLLGIESGNSRILQRFCKRTTVIENERAIADVRDVGIEPEIGFIMFDPMSTIEDIRENLSFLERNHLLDRLSRTVNLLCHEHIAFKGTPGYRLAANRAKLAPEGLYGFEGRLIYEDWRTGWLASMIKAICGWVLTEMGKQGSHIHWYAEGPGKARFQEVNGFLVHIFRKLLNTAAGLPGQPEANWTGSQLAGALTELGEIIARLPAEMQFNREEGDHALDASGLIRRV